jgi:hypothetical protein
MTVDIRGAEGFPLDGVVISAQDDGMNLGELKRLVDRAVGAYGESAKFIASCEDENPVIEADIHPCGDSGKTGAPVCIHFNTTEIVDEEW